MAIPVGSINCLRIQYEMAQLDILILGSSSSKILMNGRPSQNIRHAKGLRQGDPLSPLLFIIGIDLLQRIIEQAAEQGLLQPVLPRQAKLRCSLYADDVALFANPSILQRVLRSKSQHDKD